MNVFRGALYLLGASVIWGGMCVIGKYTTTSVPPLTVVFMRFLVACVVLGCLVHRNGLRRIDRADWPRVAMLGVIGCTVSIGTQFEGIHLSTAHMSAILTATSPIFIALLGPLFLRERIKVKYLVSLVVATAGTVITTIGPSQADGDGELLGNILLVVAAATWGLYSVLGKPLNQKYDADVVLFWAVLIGTVCLAPFTGVEIAELGMHLPSTPTAWFGVFYLGIFSTAAAFLFWNKGFELMPSQIAGLFQFVQPVVGSVLAWVILRETLSASFLSGSVLVILGIFISLVQTPKRRLFVERMVE